MWKSSKTWRLVITKSPQPWPVRTSGEREFVGVHMSLCIIVVVVGSGDGDGSYVIILDDNRTGLR